MPIGVVGAISPFNFPLNLVAHKLAPALAAGCAVVLKPASQTPVSALRLAAICEEAGLPAGWLNVIPGKSSEIGDVLLRGRARSHDHVHRLVRGGMEHPLARRAEEGRARARQRVPGARRGRRRPRPRLAKVATHAFNFAGQTCISVQRVYVRSEVFDDFVARLVPKVEALRTGDPAEDTTDVGPGHRPRESGARARLDRGGEGRRRDGSAWAAVIENGVIRPTVLGGRHARDEGVLAGGLRAGLLDRPDRLARGGHRARELDRVRPPGRDLHQLDRTRGPGDAVTRVRQRDDQRGARVAGRPDALRRARRSPGTRRKGRPTPCGR